MSLEAMLASNMGGPRAYQAARQREHEVAQAQATRQQTLADVAAKQQQTQQTAELHPLAMEQQRLANQGAQFGLAGKENDADLAGQQMRVRGQLGDQFAVEGAQNKRKGENADLIEKIAKTTKSAMNIAAIKGDAEGVITFARQMVAMGQKEQAEQLLAKGPAAGMALIKQMNEKIGTLDPEVSKTKVIDADKSATRLAEDSINRDADLLVWKEKEGISQKNRIALALLKDRLENQTAATGSKEAKTMEHQFVRSTNILQTSKDPKERAHAQAMIDVIQAAMAGKAVASAGAIIGPDGRPRGYSPTRESREKIGLTGGQIADTLSIVNIGGREMSLDDAFRQARALPQNKKRSDAELREWLSTFGK